MKLTSLYILICTILISVVGCGYNPGQDSEAGKKQIIINMVGSSILEPVIKDLTENWNAWRGLNGMGSVTVEGNYDASTKLTDELLESKGKGMALAILGSDADRKRLERAGLAGERNRPLAKFGVVAQTPLVIVTAAGNPSDLHELTDLTRPNLKVLLPSPTDSSLGQWTIITLYHLLLQQNAGNENAARLGLTNFKRNATKQPANAHQALQTLKEGGGVALIAYEADALEFIKAEASQELAIVTPTKTMMCDFVICLLDNIPDKDEAIAVTDFVSYLSAEAGQRIFIRHYFNSPIFPEMNPPTRYANVKSMLHIDDFGGFELAKKEIVEGIWANL
jgi:sulfate/thiosulfate transport system substrate-binding protein